MAALVLTSSTGFAWTEHVCRISQQKTYFFDARKSCCAAGKHQRASEPASEKSAVRVKRDGCCALKTVVVKTTVAPVPVVKTASKISVTEALPPLNFVFGKIAAASVRDQTLPPSRRSGAPPLAGRTLLVFVGRWLI